MIIVVRRIRRRDALGNVLGHPAFEEPRPRTPSWFRRRLPRRRIGRHRLNPGRVAP